MEKVNAHIQKVKDMIHGQSPNALSVGEEDTLSSMKQAMKILNRVREEVREIQKDPTLSAVGIAQKEREAKERGAVELAKMVRQYKATIDKELESAEKAARAIIDKPSAKPPQTYVSEFTEKYQELKTELAVFGSSAHAHRMLDFMNSVTDPYFAKMLKDGFAEYGTALRAHVDHMKLSTVYEKVKRVAETDERTVAKKALEEIGMLRNALPVSGMISMGIRQTLGSEYESVLTDYEQFLKSKGE
ncbi:hypothetical protein ABE430_13800 [Brevibacillus agri]|uniref:hypothetical protein n=1 Tax=Brevibacillus TaxID=55080 RepID=UPI00203D793A|nr:hypothetical protein [Brevibacillus borstelensis]MCM3592502.1 hypothetical protein [Brevibacillus borstelensis]